MSDSTEEPEYYSDEPEENTYDLRILMMCGTSKSLEAFKTVEIIQKLCDHGHLNKFMGKTKLRPLIRSITNISQIGSKGQDSIDMLTKLYKNRGIALTHIDSLVNCDALDLYADEKYNVIFDEYCPGICESGDLKNEINRIIHRHFAKDGRFVTVVPTKYKIPNNDEIMPIPESLKRTYIGCLPAMALKLESIYDEMDSLGTCYYVYGRTKFVAVKSRKRPLKTQLRINKQKKQPRVRLTKKELKQTIREFKAQSRKQR